VAIRVQYLARNSAEVPPKNCMATSLTVGACLGEEPPYEANANHGTVKTSKLRSDRMDVPNLATLNHELFGQPINNRALMHEGPS
jgi:hypothetical protein